MALLDKAYKQRMVGALVLVALAVIFLPMLFSRQDEQRQVTVDAPAAPQAPSVPPVQVEQVAVPEPQALPQEPVPSDEELAQEPAAPVAPAPTAPAPAVPSKPVAAPTPVPAAPAIKPAPTQPITAAPKPDTTQSRVDANGLSVSWSVQLASLTSRDSAEKLQKNLRSQGYNAYIRSADGKNRVFVGPLIERAEADRLRDLLNRQQNLKGFVVRFQPERG
ncbi:SPOR domain-containing protein [Pseudomonas brassicacearum]|uniref:SPOR domain-containing protein n=1 Tax=Pseudomonas brassicacearum subsp. neoaurantiaca TaxID=494916 RepID=A0A7V8RN08_9PSED|nr:SPOR domain-containing protein [Pseudomonas brassicacearum]MBA1379529.1 SPOR domain-containing protein [Pseudomonas brassicacearum subsp. neoaurantiaca]